MSQLLSHNHIPNLVFKNIEVTNGIIVALLKNIVKLIVCDYKKQYNEDFYHCFYSVGKSFIMQMKDEELFTYITNKTYKESKLYEKIENLSKDITSKTLFQIVNQIIDDFDIYNKIITIGDIENNITRIEYTLKIVDSMDKLEMNIFDFVEYIDDILENGEKMEFSASGIGENKVKIMTIHKSKGLEFPIVYFINNDKLFNKSEYKDKFIYDNKYGIIAPYYIQGEGKNVDFILMKENNNVNMISERIRLLYVALTRAREQIIILNSYKEDDEEFDIFDEEVSLLKKKKYNSFASIYNSIKKVMSEYCVYIDPVDLNINDNYLKALKQDYKEYIRPNDIVITHKENNISVIENQSVHASKSAILLKTQEEIQAMEYGTLIHKFFESCNFKNPEFNLYDENEKKLLQNFLNQPLMRNLNDGKIYKEYEFIEEINDKTLHGIIDLMIVYKDHIDIIDYKLSNVDDEAYVEQLNTYKDYIERKSNKKVSIYLYSVLKDEMEKVI